MTTIQQHSLFHQTLRYPSIDIPLAFDKGRFKYLASEQNKTNYIFLQIEKKYAIVDQKKADDILKKYQCTQCGSGTFFVSKEQYIKFKEEIDCLKDVICNVINPDEFEEYFVFTEKSKQSWQEVRDSLEGQFGIERVDTSLKKLGLSWKELEIKPLTKNVVRDILHDLIKPDYIELEKLYNQAHLLWNINNDSTLSQIEKETKIEELGLKSEILSSICETFTFHFDGSDTSFETLSNADLLLLRKTCMPDGAQLNADYIETKLLEINKINDVSQRWEHYKDFLSKRVAYDELTEGALIPTPNLYDGTPRHYQIAKHITSGSGKDISCYILKCVDAGLPPIVLFRGNPGRGAYPDAIGSDLEPFIGYTAYTSKRNEIFKTLREEGVLEEENIEVIGHSKGGVHAEYLAYDLARVKDHPSKVFGFNKITLTLHNSPTAHTDTKYFRTMMQRLGEKLSFKRIIYKVKEDNIGNVGHNRHLGSGCTTLPNVRTDLIVLSSKDVISDEDPHGRCLSDFDDAHITILSDAASFTKRKKPIQAKEIDKILKKQHSTILEGARLFGGLIILFILTVIALLPIRHFVSWYKEKDPNAISPRKLEISKVEQQANTHLQEKNLRQNHQPAILVN